MIKSKINSRNTLQLISRNNVLSEIGGKRHQKILNQKTSITLGKKENSNSATAKKRISSIETQVKNKTIDNTLSTCQLTQKQFDDTTEGASVSLKCMIEYYLPNNKNENPNNRTHGLVNFNMYSENQESDGEYLHVIMYSINFPKSSYTKTLVEQKNYFTFTSANFLCFTLFPLKIKYRH